MAISKVLTTFCPAKSGLVSTASQTPPHSTIFWMRRSFSVSVCVTLFSLLHVVLWLKVCSQHANWTELTCNKSTHLHWSRAASLSWLDWWLWRNWDGGARSVLNTCVAVRLCTWGSWTGVELSWVCVLWTSLYTIIIVVLYLQSSCYGFIVYCGCFYMQLMWSVVDTCLWCDRRCQPRCYALLIIASFAQHNRYSPAIIMYLLTYLLVLTSVIFSLHPICLLLNILPSNIALLSYRCVTLSFVRVYFYRDGNRRGVLRCVMLWWLLSSSTSRQNHRYSSKALFRHRCCWAWFDY